MSSQVSYYDDTLLTGSIIKLYIVIKLNIDQKGKCNHIICCCLAIILLHLAALCLDVFSFLHSLQAEEVLRLFLWTDKNICSGGGWIVITSIIILKNLTLTPVTLQNFFFSIPPVFIFSNTLQILQRRPNTLINRKEKIFIW